VTNIHLTAAGVESGKINNVFRSKTNAPSAITFIVSEAIKKVLVFITITF